MGKKKGGQWEIAENKKRQLRRGGVRRHFPNRRSIIIPADAGRKCTLPRLVGASVFLKFEGNQPEYWWVQGAPW